MNRLTGRRADNAPLVKACRRGSQPLQSGFRRGALRQDGRRVCQKGTQAVSLCPRLSRPADCASPGNAVRRFRDRLSRHFCPGFKTIATNSSTSRCASSACATSRGKQFLFATQHEMLAVDAAGGIAVGEAPGGDRADGRACSQIEARDCVDRSGFLGRWFAAAGTTPTIYAAWGVAP